MVVIHCVTKPLSSVYIQLKSAIKTVIGSGESSARSAPCPAGRAHCTARGLNQRRGLSHPILTIALSSRSSSSSDRDSVVNTQTMGQTATELGNHKYHREIHSFIHSYPFINNHDDVQWDIHNISNKKTNDKREGKNYPWMLLITHFMHSICRAIVNSRSL